MEPTDPTPTTRDDPVDSRGVFADAAADRLGAGIVLVAAIFLGIAAVRAPRGEEPEENALREVGVPQPIEPIGIVDDPPTRFTWTPGGDDVDLSQVIVYGRDMARLWETAPLDTNVAMIPLDAYANLKAGQTCFWRVREVSDGKARAASALKVFAFRRDLAGNVTEPKLPPEFAAPPSEDEAASVPLMGGD